MREALALSANACDAPQPPQRCGPVGRAGQPALADNFDTVVHTHHLFQPENLGLTPQLHQ
jgi:hypothetical protein